MVKHVRNPKADQFEPGGGSVSDWSFSGALRGGLVLAGFLALTLPLMPVQALFKRAAPAWARTFPHWYHKQVCRLLGIRVHVVGTLAADRPVLLVANHSSWLDIPVLSSIAPVSFVAKREVGGWLGVGALARLQRTVFVDRARRAEAGRTAGEIAARLAAGDSVVLFAEGTSTDGNRVLPFRSALFAAAMPEAAGSAIADTGVAPGKPSSDAVLQTAAVVYTHVHGVPLSRADRPLTGWYGDMDMIPHGWSLLKAGPLDVTIRLGVPVPLKCECDRKRLARDSEAEVRAGVVTVLRDPGAREWN